MGMYVHLKKASLGLETRHHKCLNHFSWYEQIPSSKLFELIFTEFMKFVLFKFLLFFLFNIISLYFVLKNQFSKKMVNL